MYIKLNKNPKFIFKYDAENRSLNPISVIFLNTESNKIINQILSENSTHQN